MTVMLFSTHRPKQHFLICVITCLFISGCSNNIYRQYSANDEHHNRWLQSILNYNSLEPDQPQQQEGSFFKVTDAMHLLVQKKFAHQPKTKAVENLARWLMNENGHNMQYELDANLTPIEAFEQKRGNCLSFTLLLIHLAKTIDIKLDYNDVYLPNLWEFEAEQNNYILLRHVNAVRKTPKIFQIFDLAIEEYDYGYPQKVITEKQAVALLNSNLAIENLIKNNFKKAFHHIKYSISLHKEKPDFWINLGVIYKKNNQLDLAEKAFLHALQLNDVNSLAASNLERLYTQLQQLQKANYFNKLAHKARQKNPYFHYKIAKKHLNEKRFNLAKKAISHAIKLHRQDPRFYVLSSTIKQHLQLQIPALKDMLIAQQLTVDNEKKHIYSKKIHLLASKIKEKRY